jgi:hypothetical protein
MMLSRFKGRHDMLLALLVLTVSELFSGTFSFVALVSNGRSCTRVDVDSTLVYRNVCAMSLLNY